MARPFAFLDSLFNLVSGLGSAADKSTATAYGYSPLPPDQLENAYRGDWIARKIVNIPAADATREWRSWQADAPVIERIEAEERRLNIPQKTQKAMTLGRLYGGAVMILGIKGQNPEEELDPERIGLGGLEFVHVLNRYEITTGPIIRDVTSKWYGEPEWYSRAGADQTVKIHPSRVIRFLGNASPVTYTRTVADEAWSDSVLQVVDDAVKGSGTVVQTIAALVHEAKIDVIKVPGLTENVADPAYRDRLIKRFALAQTNKSVNNALILDQLEEWERVQTNFAGFSDLIAAYLMIASGAADIPATRLIGQSPKGLNATGESDVRNYYDMVSSGQKNELTPALARLDDCLIASAAGKRDPSVFYLWTPLWQMSEADKAEIASKKSATFEKDLSNWLGDPAPLFKARVAQLIDDGTYPSLEMEVEEAGGLGALEVLDPTERDPKSGGTLGAPEPDPVLAPVGKRPALPAPSAANRPPVRDAARPVSMFDMAPKPLYVYRSVLNAEEILRWAREQGFTDLYSKDELHVTVMWSRTAVDWFKVTTDYWSQNDKGELTVAPGGPRAVEVFGPPTDQVTVLQFAHSYLQYRHRDLLDAGAEHSFPEYLPHISFSRSVRDLDDVVPYRGRILLGPEIFEEAK